MDGEALFWFGVLKYMYFSRVMEAWRRALANVSIVGQPRE